MYVFLLEEFHRTLAQFIYASNQYIFDHYFLVYFIFMELEFHYLLICFIISYAM